MDKAAIKNFAVWARNKLIADITYQASLIGVSENGIAKPLPQSSRDLQIFDIGTRDYAQVAGKDIGKRNALVNVIRERERGSDYPTACQSVMEEIAYTWFNRLIAIRFMEVNDYLPSRIRVLSSENPGKKEPDFVTDPFDTDLEFTAAESEEVQRLKDENKLNELFRMLFIRQCNKLHEILPELFEKTDDYTELLLNISFTDEDGILWHLVHDIPEDDFNVEKEGQVEIIGWLYQYYNIEPKNQVFADLKKNIKISKDKIPAATQLFTPDWIVRYMVENSLGRIFIDQWSVDSGQSSGPWSVDSSQICEQDRITAQEKIAAKMGWKYFLPEAEQEPDVRAQLEEIRKEYRTISPDAIRLVDPSMGSAHILVCAFDVLMQIYESCGWEQREAAQSIVKNNLYGLDIDGRAAQLAYFAVMMKARQYDRRFLTRGIAPHVKAIIGSDRILDAYQYEKSNLQLPKEYQDTLDYILDVFQDAKEYGSILQLEDRDYVGLKEAWEAAACSKAENANLTLWQSDVEEMIPQLIEQAIVLSQKYDVAVTNPPYMAVSNASAKVQGYVKKHFPDAKADMFAVFMERCGELIRENGYQAMITQHSWMFLSSFEKLRKKLQAIDTVNMVHLGARAFEEIGGEVVQTTSFVFRKSHIPNYQGVYCRLIEPTTQQGKEELFLSGDNRYTARQSNFSKIPGSPVAYWVSDQFIKNFRNTSVGNVLITREGMATANNDKFLRFWFELQISNIEFQGDNNTILLGQKVWVPYNKGGDFRKWYGNNDYVVYWKNNGEAIKNNIDARSGRIRSHNYNGLYGFREGITWTAISSGNIGVRYCPRGYLFDSKGAKGFSEERSTLFCCLGLINSKIGKAYLEVLSPTIDFKVGDIIQIPYCFYNALNVAEKVKMNVFISRTDWDSFETSWDFKRHPLLPPRIHAAEAGADGAETMETEAPTAEAKAAVQEATADSYNAEQRDYAKRMI